MTETASRPAFGDFCLYGDGEVGLLRGSEDRWGASSLNFGAFRPDVTFSEECTLHATMTREQFAELRYELGLKLLANLWYHDPDTTTNDRNARQWHWRQNETEWRRSTVTPTVKVAGVFLRFAQEQGLDDRQAAILWRLCFGQHFDAVAVLELESASPGSTYVLGS